MQPSAEQLRISRLLAPDRDAVFLVTGTKAIMLCERGGFVKVAPSHTLWLLGSMERRSYVEVRTFVERTRLSVLPLYRVDDHELLALVRDHVRTGRLVGVRPSGEASHQTSDESAQQRRLIRKIEQSVRGRLGLGGRTYKLVADVDLAKLAGRDNYEVVARDEAQRVLAGLIAQDGAGDLAGLLRQASEGLTRDWRAPHSHPNGIILLRRMPVIAAASREAGSAMTPSQMRALLEKARLRIHVVDLNGNPQKGMAFSVMLPDGGNIQGRLDDEGRGEAKSSAPGVFIVRFPDLDGADWDGDGALALPPQKERSEASKHTVAQGERLPTIARAEGFARWQTVWEFAGNAALRETRGRAHILWPGDQVAIPSKLERVAEVQGGQAEYVVQAAPEPLRVRFAEAEAIDEIILFRATPDAGDEMFEGELADDGTMEVDLPPNTTQVTVQLYCGDADDPFVTYEFAVGGVDPVTENSGIQARLASLGYYDGDINGTLDDATKGAIARFRREYGLPLSDAIDEDLRNALTWVCDDDDDTADCVADQCVLDDSRPSEAVAEAPSSPQEDEARDATDVDESDGEAEMADTAEDAPAEEVAEEDWPEPDDEELCEWTEEDWGDISNGGDDSNDNDGGATA